MTEQNADQQHNWTYGIDPRGMSRGDYELALEAHTQRARRLWWEDQAALRARDEQTARDRREAAADIKAASFAFLKGSANVAWWLLCFYLLFWQLIPSATGGIGNWVREACLKDVAACTAKVKG